MTITVEKLKEAVAERCDCSFGALGVAAMVPWRHIVTALEKLLAAEPKPRGLTDEEIMKQWYCIQKHDGSGYFPVALARWAIEQSQPAMCKLTDE